MTNPNPPFLPPLNPRFTFIDLFAGIGGFRLALQRLGGKCIFSSEFDNYAQKTYFDNFGETPSGDITLEKTKSKIPETFDILCGGFPCQAFSIAGKRKGFDDIRGTLFFDVAEIIKKHQPKAFFLENVKGLKDHDSGKTIETIIRVLHELNYSVESKILNSKDFGNVPQTRERMYIIGFKNEYNKSAPSPFIWSSPIERTLSVQNILEKQVPTQYEYERFSIYQTLKEHVKNHNTAYQWRRHYVRENKNNVFPTMTANMGTGGHNVPIVLDANNKIRKITPRECARLQGYPENYILPKIADSHLYKQLGNSVTVIQAIASNILKHLRDQKQ